MFLTVGLFAAPFARHGVRAVAVDRRSDSDGAGLLSAFMYGLRARPGGVAIPRRNPD